MVGVEQGVKDVGRYTDHPKHQNGCDQTRWRRDAMLLKSEETQNPGKHQVQHQLRGQRPANRVPESRKPRAPGLQGKRRQHHTGEELEVSVGLPFERQKRHGKQQHKQINRVNTRQPSHVKAPLRKRRAVSIVVSQNEAGDQKEEADEGECVVDNAPQEHRHRGREVKKHDVDGKQRAKAGEGREGWPGVGQGVGRGGAKLGLRVEGGGG